MSTATGERDLTRLISGMRPELREGEYVFTHAPEVPPGVRPVATVAEDEAITIVCTRADADAAGLPYDYVAAWIELKVHSALEAVGLTAAVAGALGREGLSCNVVAGFFHDHLFVPYDERERAVSALEDLAAGG
ncbi:ACT domain-containing protein [Nocardiopsis sp. RSe5-2]|uniref:ACT domain-containing protein n=1 Tax=Nocardiopsis endophytica TaxID=3018445 RepID=A0ABT4U5W6_9ACTN|nr:ACT domain-containing protein [Nocardiopsis endophytica]MDA2811737.1 ACT domain-containing protein [Nocardiopsis endophytica]